MFCLQFCFFCLQFLKPQKYDPWFSKYKKAKYIKICGYMHCYPTNLDTLEKPVWIKEKLLLSGARTLKFKVSF